MASREPGYSGDIAKPPKEVEKKYLIYPDMIPRDLEVRRALAIKQAYLAIAADGSEIRIRSTDDKEFEVGAKSDGTFIRDEPTPIPISREMFETLSQKAVGSIIEKMRLEIPWGIHLIELDIYSGDLEDLMVAEVEFKKRAESDPSPEEQAAAFVAPYWFGPEVTMDKGFKNKNLATKGFPGSLPEQLG